MMFLAKELHKSLDEILEISTLEFRMWAAYYRLDRARQQEAIAKTKAKRNRGRG